LEGRIQIISGMCPAFEQEQDLQNLFRMATALGNLCYKSDDAFELLSAMDVTFPDLNKLQGADQPDAARSIQTIKEIRAMLKI
jgi:hypothetical protein